jgi:hypothetical protein
MSVPGKKQVVASIRCERPSRESKTVKCVTFAFVFARMRLLVTPSIIVTYNPSNVSESFCFRANNHACKLRNSYDEKQLELKRNTRLLQLSALVTSIVGHLQKSRVEGVGGWASGVVFVCRFTVFLRQLGRKQPVCWDCLAKGVGKLGCLWMLTSCRRRETSMVSVVVQAQPSQI